MTYKHLSKTSPVPLQGKVKPQPLPRYVVAGGGEVMGGFGSGDLSQNQERSTDHLSPAIKLSFLCALHAPRFIQLTTDRSNALWCHVRRS